jgi:hypothetical protein
MDLIYAGCEDWALILVERLATLVFVDSRPLARPMGRAVVIIRFAAVNRFG